MPAGGTEFSFYQGFQTLNNLSQITGVYRDADSKLSAYFFDPLLHGNQSIDLNDVCPDLDGQFIVQAFDINDLGMITVFTVSDRSLSIYDPNNTIIPGVIDTLDDFHFYALPAPVGTFAAPMSINDSNDVAIEIRNALDGPRSTYVALFDATTRTWSLMQDFYAEMYSASLSDRLPSGDLYLVGRSVGDQATVRINLLNPSAGGVFLPVQIQINDIE